MFPGGKVLEFPFLMDNSDQLDNQTDLAQLNYHCSSNLQYSSLRVQPMPHVDNTDQVYKEEDEPTPWDNNNQLDICHLQENWKT